MQLTTVQESPSEEYLCDYVYIDSVRLAHYYSQLSQHGLITVEKKTSKDIGKQSSDLQVKAMVVAGKVAGERTNEEWIELSVDPAFNRPQETMDALYDAGYIGDSLTDARMGSLVLVKGSISIFDIRILKEVWSFMADFVANGATNHIQNVKDRQRAAAAAKKEFEQIASIISRMPHSLQGNLTIDSAAAWFTLKPDFMLVSPEDLTFKHGSDLKGEWHVLGIVDALPDQAVSEASSSQHPATELETAMRTMLEGLRGMFGRPSERFGLTPIMIFRTIKKTN